MSDEHVAYDGQDLEALVGLRNYPRWVVDLLGPAPWGATVEIGAGTGNLSRFARSRTTRMTLLEPSHLAGSLRGSFEDDPDVEVVPMTSGAWLAERPEMAGTFDTVFSVNVLEHIDDDLGVLRDAWRLLRPGGWCRIAVPALPGLMGSLDELVGHRRRYRRRALEGMMQAAGFTEVRAFYFDALGVFPWYVAGRVLRRRRFDPGPALAFDRVAIPLGRALESIRRPPLGKNLACIARKSL